MLARRRNGGSSGSASSTPMAPYAAIATAEIGTPATAANGDSLTRSQSTYSEIVQPLTWPASRCLW